MPAAPEAKARIEMAKQTWFFEQPNGTIIAVQEEEAWRLFSGKNQIIGQRPYPPKIIGTSSGMIYQEAVHEAVELKKQGKEDESRIRLQKGFEDELAEARKTPRRPRNFDTINQRRQPTTITDVQNGIV